MPRSFEIVTLAGTAVRLHWTFVLFALALFSVVFLTDGLAEALRVSALILAIFVCVVLHEFGHIRVARMFGIETPEVMLLPIGGLAKLNRIPEDPKQEFAIAIAGPLVNFILFAVLVILPGVGPDWNAIVVLGLDQASFLEQLAIFNLMVGLFNLLPAFPMDGGRILRAALAFMMPHHSATMIAARIGQVIAIGMVGVGLYNGSFILIIIGAFIFLAARTEAHVNSVRHAIGGTPVTRVMVTDQPRLKNSDPIAHAAAAIVETDNEEFPVFDNEDQFVGILLRDDLLKALEEIGPDAAIKDAIKTNVQTVNAKSRAEAAAELIESGATAIAVINERGQFLGIVNWRNTVDVLAIEKALDRWRMKQY